MATQACDTRNLIQNVARDITDNANANTRSIMDFLVQDKISTLTAENQALKFAASQASQNAFITANQEAQTAELIRRLGRDCPVPAYVVPNPNCCYGNPLGVGYSGNYGGGCGCGCAA
jgi:phage-related baseplate assembly protein